MAGKIKGSIFIKSLKPDSSLLGSILLNSGCIVSIIIISLAAFFLFGKSLSAVEGTIPILEQTVTAVTAGAITESLHQQVVWAQSVFKKVIAKTIIIALSAYLLAILSISLFQGMLYSRLLKEKFDRAFIKRFTLLNLAWFTSWTIIAVLIGKIININVAAIIIVIEIILFAHFTLILYSLFDKKKGMLSLMRSALSLGTKKALIFIGAYILAYIVLMLLMIVLWLVTFLKLQLVTFILAVIFGLAYISWLKKYIVEVVKCQQ